MGGDLTSSGFQNNLYDNFLCFPSWTCGIFLPSYSASCHCDKLWETQYKGGQGSLGMWSEPQVSWAHYLSPRGEANTTVLKAGDTEALCLVVVRKQKHRKWLGFRYASKAQPQ